MQEAYSGFYAVRVIINKSLLTVTFVKCWYIQNCTVSTDHLPNDGVLVLSDTNEKPTGNNESAIDVSVNS